MYLSEWNSLGCINVKASHGIHNIAGADWGGKFVQIAKKTWIDAYLKFDDKDQAMNYFE